MKRYFVSSNGKVFCLDISTYLKTEEIGKLLKMDVKEINLGQYLKYMEEKKKK